MIFMSAQTSPDPLVTPRGRDLRLDLFRGCAMIIILIAHIPFNRLSNYIPARYGWSDAADIFVFCSGMASALAFGAVFVRRNWMMGTARVAYRVWQVYWAHIGLFVAIAATMAALDLSGIFATYGSFDKSYVNALNLTRFFTAPIEGLVGLVTLTYVPNYFDILPMYLVILAMIPPMMALSRIDPRLAMAASVLLWCLAQTGALDLPAEPWSDRPWFFNPFAWQLIFFTGFAFARGWLPVPPVSRALIVAAIVFLAVSIPFGRWQIWTEVEWIRSWREANEVLFSKTNAGILRYLHFLSLAYLAVVLAGPGGERLRPRGDGTLPRLARMVVAQIVKIGQQSLAVFVFSMWLALMLGFVLDFTVERGWWPTLGVNLAGIALILGVAHLVAWVKSSPWKTTGTNHTPARTASTAQAAE
jgi:hypothetical protein